MSKKIYFLNANLANLTQISRIYSRSFALDLRKFAFNLIFVSLFFLNGCAAAVIGGAAAVGVIAVSQDFVTTSVDVDFQRVWQISNAQLKKMGTVNKSFQKIGEIKATVEGASIRVKITKLTERTTDIKISAWKNLLPNNDLAQTVLASILRKF